jgi:hypothetical protein
VHGKLGSLCPCIKGLLARLAAQVYNPQDIPSSYTTQTHLLYTNISLDSLGQLYFSNFTSPELYFWSFLSVKIALWGPPISA